MSAIFGGKKSSSTSNTHNRAYDTLATSFTPLLGNAATGAESLMALLSGDPTGFNAYKNATGFDATAEAGSRGITGNAAARGLLRSGSTGKALQAYGTNLQNQFAGDYMDRLLAQAQLGFNAGSLLSSAGTVQDQKSSSSEKPGLGRFIGGIASGVAASDRRLKKDIVKIKKLASGLNLYSYRYIDGTGPYIGVMADEVEKVVPEALGPVVNGFKTVDYSKLEGVSV